MEKGNNLADPTVMKAWDIHQVKNPTWQEPTWQQQPFLNFFPSISERKNLATAILRRCSFGFVLNRRLFKIESQNLQDGSHFKNNSVHRYLE